MIKNLWNIDPNGAIFSPCRPWRYRLHRIWHPDKPMAAFIGLNPSTADEVRNDPTLTGASITLAAGDMEVWLCSTFFAYRATAPRDLKAALSPVGELNDLHIFESASRAALVVAAWGTHGEFMGRGEKGKASFSGWREGLLPGQDKCWLPPPPPLLGEKLKTHTLPGNFPWRRI